MKRMFWKGFHPKLVIQMDSKTFQFSVKKTNWKENPSIVKLLSWKAIPSKKTYFWHGRFSFQCLTDNGGGPLTNWRDVQASLKHVLTDGQENNYNFTLKICFLFLTYENQFYFRKTAHMPSFLKIKPLWNGEITLSLTDLGKSYICREFLTSQILAKIFEFTEVIRLHL